MEIDRKFKTGSSIYDDPRNENVLGDAIDIPRVIRRLPTPEDYKNI